MNAVELEDVLPSGKSQGEDTVSRTYLDYIPPDFDYALSDSNVCVHYQPDLDTQGTQTPHPIRKHAQCCSASKLTFDARSMAPLNGCQIADETYAGVGYPTFLVWPVIHLRHRPLDSALVAPHLWPGSAHLTRRISLDTKTDIYMALASATGYLPGLEDAGAAGQQFIVRFAKHHPDDGIPEPSLPRNEPISAESSTLRELRRKRSRPNVEEPTNQDHPLLACLPYPFLKYFNFV